MSALFQIPVFELMELWAELVLANEGKKSLRRARC